MNTEPILAAPDDDEVWRYTHHTGRWFLQLSAFSRAVLGVALGFLALRGDWLKLLLPVAAMMIGGSLISLVWSFQLRPFDRQAHADRLRWRADRPSGPVDVFITTCGEDPDVIRNTILHASRLKHTGEVRLYVLDDKNSPTVREHAEEFGATYLHRPNPGWMKKSGNLHHAYGRSTGEFIVVLDADFAVRPDFLDHTLPYFTDWKIGIVQTPQYFRVDRENWVECGAAAQQEQFYRIMQRARDHRGGAICVGTNAVYRRSALDARGGMALLEHSEDLFTGMKVIDAGYRVKYLPIVVAAGSAPSTTKSLASQQYRWARGTFALAGTPLFKRLRLTFMQRMSIWDGWIYYASSALAPVVAVLVPILTLAEAPGAISLAPAVMLAPALITEFVVQPRWLFLSDGPASRRVGLISQLAHLYALRDHLSDREQEWVPTGDVVGGHRQATDRIPQLIAAGGFWCFLVTMSLVAMRVADGYDVVALAPLVALALIAMPTALTVTNHPDRRTAEDEAGAVPDRDGFLDTVRGISIIRVLFWHALGFWWISWVFAAMPAVFYVSGALVAKSLKSKPVWVVVRGRLRRLLPPYLVFVGVSLVAVSIAQPDVWRTRSVDLLSWIVPFQSPARLPWEEGWLSTPLWFMRALLLVLVVLPVGVRLARLLSPPSWVIIWGSTLLAIDVIVEHQRGVRATAVIRGIGDLVCFGGFFALGAAGHHLRFRFGTRARLHALVALIASTAVVTWFAPPPGRVVNNSNVTMALVGLCWLLAILVFEKQLRRIGGIPGIHRVLGWVAANSMTVYLWHTAVLCIAFAVVGPPANVEDGFLFALVFGPLLVAAVVTLRPFEHRWSSSRRGHPVRPLRLLAAGGVVVVLAMQPTLFPKLTGVVGPPAPSARPEVGLTDDGLADVDRSEYSAGGIDGWMTGNGVTSAAVVTVGGPDGTHRTETFAGAVEPGSSGPGDQPAIDPDRQFEVLSVTKTMVAATALQLVDEGALTLDGPLPDIDGLPPELTQHVTLRRLLSHASGLVDYRNVSVFRATTATDPRAAVLASFRQSDLTSQRVEYAATNFFLVGLAIEQVTGSTLAAELQHRLFEPLHLDHTVMIDNSRDGFVGFASAGVVSTLDDLATWYDALFRRHAVLSDAMLREMLWGGEQFAPGTGLGAWRHCPCRAATADDTTPWTYVFHDGGDLRIMYFPDEDVVMVARFSKALYLTPALADDLDGFAFQVLDQVTDSPGS